MRSAFTSIRSAKLLHRQGFTVRIFHTSPAEELKGDALRAWNELPPEIERRTELHAVDLADAIVIDAFAQAGHYFVFACHGLGEVEGDVAGADTPCGGFANEVDALYNRLNNCPVPTTPVYGRTPIFTCNNNGCGCGCGA